jgi:molybdopterin synthase catalytic subunit
MDINGIVERMRQHPDAEKIGMIATHLGIVRGSSRDGRPVTAIDVAFDEAALDQILTETKALPGIVDVAIEINSGHLQIGDVIMFVAIAGDIREHVFEALTLTVDRIKKESSRKTEFFK